MPRLKMIPQLVLVLTLAGLISEIHGFPTSSFTGRTTSTCTSSNSMHHTRSMHSMNRNQQNLGLEAVQNQSQNQNHNEILSPRDDTDTDTIRAQIEEMRQEAANRLETLNKQVKELDQAEPESEPTAPRTSMNEVIIEETVQIQSSSSLDKTKLTSEDEVEPLTAIRSSKDQTREEKPTPRRAPQPLAVGQNNLNRLELLDGTTWKIMLNIGREPGTWMPKAWGESGERLLLNLAVELSSDQLYEREEFLNSMAGAKVLKVVDSELTIGPSLTEGRRNISVKDGGWRVAPGEGPAGTDLLRFFIEIEDDIQHTGCDVYCPKVRT
jgi:hypothetical protein